MASVKSRILVYNFGWRKIVQVDQKNEFQANSITSWSRLINRRILSHTRSLQKNQISISWLFNMANSEKV